MDFVLQSADNLKVDRSLFTVQVEEGSAKLGRDFSHSTASLIQFDPGLFRTVLLHFTPTVSVDMSG